MRLNRIGPVAAAICLLLLAPVPALAQPNAGAYFVLDPQQQQIHIKRYLKANRSLLDECAPEMELEEFHEYFNQWLEENPGYFSRQVWLAFTNAIIDLCEEQDPKSNSADGNDGKHR